MQEKLENLLNQLNQIILGNPFATKLAVVCLLARGHLLIEDIPGVGKTTLSHALANLFGLPFRRIQFTSDLLPSDILGVTIYDLDNKRFRFKKGPIFTSILLADEINRAPPKTQSALLQAMEEGDVSVDGKVAELPEPFFVIATQNPLEQSGTFPLPESQLDRFLMCISLGYPDAHYERRLLSGNQGAPSLEEIQGMFSVEEILQLGKEVDQVHASEALIEYLQNLIQYTRDSGHFVTGLSPRGGLQWLRAAKALAFVEGRESVLPDDIKTLAHYTVAHRLHCSDGSSTRFALDNIISQVESI